MRYPSRQRRGAAGTKPAVLESQSRPFITVQWRSSVPHEAALSSRQCPSVFTGVRRRWGHLDTLGTHVAGREPNSPTSVLFQFLVLDVTGFLKKGTKSAGVQRQYTGTAGKR